MAQKSYAHKSHYSYTQLWTFCLLQHPQLSQQDEANNKQTNKKKIEKKLKKNQQRNKAFLPEYQWKEEWIFFHWIILYYDLIYLISCVLKGNLLQSIRLMPMSCIMYMPLKLTVWDLVTLLLLCSILFARQRKGIHRGFWSQGIMLTYSKDFTIIWVEIHRIEKALNIIHNCWQSLHVIQWQQSWK